MTDGAVEAHSGGQGGFEPSLPALNHQAAVDWAPSAGYQPTLHVLSSLASKYYEKEALLMDPVDGPILASLLGKWSSPCSELHLDLWSRLEGAPPEGLSRLPPASHLQNCSLPLAFRLLRWSLFGRSLGYPSCWRGRSFWWEEGGRTPLGDGLPAPSALQWGPAPWSTPR